MDATIGLFFALLAIMILLACKVSTKLVTESINYLYSAPSFIGPIKEPLIASI